MPWEELIDSPATRVTFRSPTGTAEDFMELVERIGLHEVNYAVGFTAWLDINPEGVSKGSALELIRRRLSVEPRHTMAVGDQRNDLEMLGWAARGVAMGNAPEEVKAVADEVAGDVEEDGLVAVLRSLRLPEPARRRQSRERFSRRPRSASSPSLFSGPLSSGPRYLAMPLNSNRAV